MPRSVNGCVTTYYGRADCGLDGSYVVIEWVVFLGIPLIPLGSKRVLPQARTSSWFMNSVATRYVTIPVPFHAPHLIKGYAVTGAIAFSLLAANFIH